jgi:hypothetical protein
MVFCGSALLAVFLGNLNAGEDAGSLSCDKKTLSSFILSHRFLGRPRFSWGGGARLNWRIDYIS